MSLFAALTRMRILLFGTSFASCLLCLALLCPAFCSTEPPQVALGLHALPDHDVRVERPETSSPAIHKRGLSFPTVQSLPRSSHGASSPGSHESPQGVSSVEVVTLPRRIDHEPRRESPEYVLPSRRAQNGVRGLSRASPRYAWLRAIAGRESLPRGSFHAVLSLGTNRAFGHPRVIVGRVTWILSAVSEGSPRRNMPPRAIVNQPDGSVELHAQRSGAVPRALASPVRPQAGHLHGGRSRVASLRIPLEDYGYKTFQGTVFWYQRNAWGRGRMQTHAFGIWDTYFHPHEYKGQLRGATNVWQRAEEIANRRGMTRKKFARQLLRDLPLLQ